MPDCESPSIRAVKQLLFLSHILGFHHLRLGQWTVEVKPCLKRVVREYTACGRPLKCRLPFVTKVMVHLTTQKKTGVNKELHRGSWKTSVSITGSATSCTGTQDIQPLINFYCMLCTFSPTAISVEGIQTIWRRKNICCDRRMLPRRLPRVILVFISAFLSFSVI